GPELARTQTIEPGTDVLVVGVATTDDGPVLLPEDLFGDVLDAELRTRLLDQVTAVGGTGKAEQLIRVPAPAGLDNVTSVLAVGLGSAEDLDAEQIRRSAGVAARSLTGVTRAVTTLSGLDIGAAV